MSSKKWDQGQTGPILAHKPFLRTLQKSDPYVSQGPPAPWQQMLHCQGPKARLRWWGLPGLTHPTPAVAGATSQCHSCGCSKGQLTKWWETSAQPRGSQNNHVAEEHWANAASTCTASPTTTATKNAACSERCFLGTDMSTTLTHIQRISSGFPLLRDQATSAFRAEVLQQGKVVFAGGLGCSSHQIGVWKIINLSAREGKKRWMVVVLRSQVSLQLKKKTDYAYALALFFFFLLFFVLPGTQW